MSPRRSEPLAILCAFILLGTTFPVDGAQAGPSNLGGQRFVEFCAGCHGADARGGDKAPSLVSSPNTTSASEIDLIRIVREGTRGGMPPFAQIGDTNIEAIVHYLRVLQGQGASAPNQPEIAVTGDTDAGRALFFGKAQCSTCHMFQGEGGFIAPGLTDYGRNRAPEVILHAITNPDSSLMRSSRVVTVNTRSGQQLTGVLRNEDSFTVDLQTEDGRYHLFARSDLTGVHYTDHSLMPGDYSTRLTPRELDDIVSFLIVAGRSPRKDTRQKN